jgi:pimeloyl-ACP methyl ester carboxylesterase
MNAPLIPVSASIRRPGMLRTAGSGMVRRARLASIPAPVDSGGPGLRLFMAEWLSFAEPLLRRFRAPLAVRAATRPQVVMLLPGFATHPARMGYMARKLEQAGHVVKRWGMGFNMGPQQDTLDLLEKRLEYIYRSHGQRVVLVGWSLGGLFARELAKRQPQMVAGVVSMGSPFSGTPYRNNVWRIYHLVTGHAVDAPPVEARLREKPPVPTIALWSPRDGMIAPRCAAGHPGERDRAIALRCSHIGFSNSPEAITAVLAQLEQL